MTTPVLTLESVSYVLPDGSVLFSHLSDTFDTRPTGLVGRNGTGKSVLARLLAGQLLPSSGRCLRSGTVHYLAQQISPPADATVATLAGLQPVLEALARVEAGSSDGRDFDTIGERWDIAHRLEHALAQQGLGHLDPQTPAQQLSGGERMRVALAGALLSDADFLILDEPSNHLDADHRQALIAQLQQWTRGLLVISHDRALLAHMTRIVELSSLGLRSYGGNYAHYADSKAREQQQAQQQLAQRKHERQRETQALREQHERQAKRQAHGHRLSKDANQAKLLLDRQKARSEASTGKLHQQQLQARQQLDRRVREAAQQVQRDAPISLHAISPASSADRCVAALDTVTLPYGAAATHPLTLQVYGQQRIGIVGANGSGKSTLLKVLSGQLDPASGRCQRATGNVYLDQQLATLNPQQSVLAQLQAAHPKAAEHDLRMRLAHLDLDAQHITVPSATLSGGERLKAALACVLYADPPPALLLLDEPSNHLDLPSLQALEAMLSSYRGALLVVSHDEVFLNNLGLTDRLQITEQGWRLAPW